MAIFQQLSTSGSQSNGAKCRYGRTHVINSSASKAHPVDGYSEKMLSDRILRSPGC